MLLLAVSFWYGSSFVYGFVFFWADLSGRPILLYISYKTDENHTYKLRRLSRVSPSTPFQSWHRALWNSRQALLLPNACDKASWVVTWYTRSPLKLSIIGWLKLLSGTQHKSDLWQATPRVAFGEACSSRTPSSCLHSLYLHLQLHRSARCAISLCKLCCKRYWIVMCGQAPASECHNVHWRNVRNFNLSEPNGSFLLGWNLSSQLKKVLSNVWQLAPINNSLLLIARRFDVAMLARSLYDKTFWAWNCCLTWAFLCIVCVLHCLQDMQISPPGIAHSCEYEWLFVSMLTLRWIEVLPWL